MAAEARQKAWFVSDKKGRSDLILSISPSELKQIRGSETSRDVCLTLESIRASKGPARKATLLKQLTLQRLEEGGDVREHMVRFFNAVDKVAAIDVDINADLLAIMLLYCLLGSYENFRCAIESRDKLPTADELKVKILEETDARKQANVLECGGAMAASRRGFKASRLNSDESNLKGSVQETFKFRCFRCHKAEHKAVDCKNGTVSGNAHHQSKAKLVEDDAVDSYAAFNIKPSIAEEADHVVTTLQKGPMQASAALAAEARQKAWFVSDKKGRSDLILSISPSELKQIRGSETSRDVCLTLESIRASKGPARKATLLKQLTLQRLEEGGDVREHMVRFFNAVDKVAAIDVDINADLLAIMLLYCLLGSYENFRCAIESRDKLPTADELKQRELIVPTDASKLLRILSSNR
ncbi:hypothetical protein J437_LFUL007951 [Ladona fulva]|uniref:Retrovirus-related Pol polyprotein from transposon TNT 1-94 n=1 Tax=Ladona fulva TaxID=123851 RepID=A0A8K0KE60_LADFU|nr:hypothetical protein J437_LFUL007951 [Ladona fulva]